MLLTILVVLLVIVYLDHKAQFIGVWDWIKSAYTTVVGWFSKPKA